MKAPTGAAPSAASFGSLDAPLPESSEGNRTILLLTRPGES